MHVVAAQSLTKELKIETFSGRRRPDWQSKPGTEVAAASRQNLNIKNADYRSGIMASHKELRESLLICYADNMLPDEEFLVLWENYESKNPDFPWDSYDPFTLVNMDEAECKAEFRVEKNDLQRLAEALQIPGTLKCYQGTVCDGMEGLTNRVMDFIYDTHGHRITQWNPAVLNPGFLEQYAAAIAGKGAALDNCFGFVDGTVRPISKPGEQQRIVYNGHKRVHALKFQSVAVPNGLIANMYGPVGMLLL